MENASKALIMAGSVFLSMIIIGVLVLMFNTISDLKNTEATTEEVQKLAEYNKQIETFNREGLYGSEILSLANLIEDYNIRQSGLRGYDSIDLTVEIIYATETFETKEYEREDLLSKFNDLEDRIDKKLDIWNNNKKEKIKISDDVTVTLEELSNMTDSKIELLIRSSTNGKEATMATIRQKIYGKNENEGLKSYEAYKELKSEMTEFKNKKYNEPQVEYDEQNGRVTSMTFVEIRN